MTSEFVDLFEDLWPRFCGPKMQHYLRNALLTLLADEPETIIELIRVLTDDGFREPFVKQLTRPDGRRLLADRVAGAARSASATPRSRPSSTSSARS